MAPAVSWKSRSCCRKRMAWEREHIQEGWGSPKEMASHTEPFQPAGQVCGSGLYSDKSNWRFQVLPWALAACTTETNPLPQMKPRSSGQAGFPLVVLPPGPELGALCPTSAVFGRHLRCL